MGNSRKKRPADYEQELDESNGGKNRGKDGDWQRDKEAVTDEPKWYDNKDNVRKDKEWDTESSNTRKKK
jgi:hypothetical protein